MPTVEELSDRYGIPEADVAELVNAALSQFEVQVSDFLRGERMAADDVMGLEGLIIANALDMALPRDVDRATGREMLQEVVRPRLNAVSSGESDFDPEEAVQQVVERNFPVSVRREIEDRMRRF